MVEMVLLEYGMKNLTQTLVVGKDQVNSVNQWVTIN